MKEDVTRIFRKYKFYAPINITKPLIEIIKDCYYFYHDERYICQDIRMMVRDLYFFDRDNRAESIKNNEDIKVIISDCDFCLEDLELIKQGNINYEYRFTLSGDNSVIPLTDREKAFLQDRGFFCSYKILINPYQLNLYDVFVQNGKHHSTLRSSFFILPKDIYGLPLNKNTINILEMNMKILNLTSTVSFTKKEKEEIERIFDGN